MSKPFLSNQPILVFGRRGQLSRAFQDLLQDQAIFIGSEQADFCSPASIVSILDQLQPKIVINCAAYTQVDLAEKELVKAEQINAVTPGEIAKWCALHDAKLVHFSTDYVFNGLSDRAWQETDQTNPINVYGQTKLRGEELIQASGASALILRTAWLYSQYGHNFVKKMLELGQTRTDLAVVDDQQGSPTYAPDVAQATCRILQKSDSFTSAKCEIYHLGGQGQTSWFHLAAEVFKIARANGVSLKLKNLRAIPTVEYPVPARRPYYSVLDTSKMQKSFDITLPPWEESLATCIRKINAMPRS